MFKIIIYSWRAQERHNAKTWNAFGVAHNVSFCPSLLFDEQKGQMIMRFMQNSECTFKRKN